MNRFDYHARYNHYDKIYTAYEAKAVLAGRLKEVLSKDIRFTGTRVVRLEVPVEGRDLLKWLAAQHQHDKTRFYFSSRDSGDIEAAGIGIADLISSKETFNYAEAFEHMRSHLSIENPYLRYYGGIAFAPGHIDADWESFGAYRFFIPRFELFLKERSTSFACNVVLNNEKPEDFEKIRSELEELRFEDYSNTTFSTPGKLLSRNDYPGYEEWEENLTRVIGEIRNHRYDKTVLARKVVLDFDTDIDPVSILFFLKENLPSRRYDFLFQFDGKKAFVGSSPEQLYKRQGRLIESEAVAGTRSRGKEEQDDIQLARELMNSDKERREHDFVIDFLEKGLSPLCTSLEVEHQKGLLKLKEGQHLISHLKGILKENAADDMLIDALHPTPAVGGCPLDKALEAIRQCEPFKRGWYAGVIGTVGCDSSDFAVGLRSGLIDKNQLCLYSGVGIVDGSIPDAEWQEVECKITNFLAIVNGKR
jgi:menaquinone-specific isochorismate synthase